MNYLDVYGNVYMHWTELSGHNKSIEPSNKIKKPERKVEPSDKSKDGSFDQYA